MNMHKNVMTADEAFAVSFNQSPELHLKDSIENSKLKYLDQMFNVIGNGIRDKAEFIQHISFTAESKHLTEIPSKYFDGSSLFRAYNAVECIDDFKMPVFGSDIDGLFTEDEINNMPEVAYTRQLKDSKRFSPVVPYPNFKKQYSLVWRLDLKEFDSSWVESAIFFYTAMKEFFESDNAHLYHDAVPNNNIQLQNLIAQYEKSFEKYKKPDQTTQEYYAALGEAYGVQYKGDTLDFIQRRWEKQKESIHQFIEETLAMLKS